MGIKQEEIIEVLEIVFQNELTNKIEKNDNTINVITADNKTITINIIRSI